MRNSACLLIAVAFSACGGGKNGTPAPLLMVCSAALPRGAVASPLQNSATCIPQDSTVDFGVCTEATTALVQCPAADVAPTGFLALGQAVKFSGFDGPFPHGIDFVVPADLSLGPPSAPSSRIVVVEKRADGAVAVVPVSNVVYEPDHHRLHFHAAELGTYQAAVPSSAGKKFMRHFTYRAVSGPSMGGIGSSLSFWSHPERYDAVATMGADPGPDLTYTMGVFRDWMLGGFCTVDDAAAGRMARDGTPAAVGKLCTPARKPLADQREVPLDFEHLTYQKGSGTGLTTSRSFWMRAFRDVFRAFGNPAYASAPDDTGPWARYLPSGVPVTTLAQAPADACAHPTVLKSFFDARYNPDGGKDVITFCDGQDGPAKGLGQFDPNVAPTDPVQILLAVDVNGNGVRDSGEPVVFQGSEPFDDVGADGLPDEREPGYDARTNPDPSHDDYHWLYNPTGTERNWRWDAGEPYRDSGVDGVKGKGCAVGSAPGCYDYGEGNGKFDYAPNMDHMRALDPRGNVEALAADAFDRLDTYYDAGINDFFNDAVSTNSLMGALQSRGQHVRVFEGFPALVGAAPSQESKFEASGFDLDPVGRHVYVRYGDPDADLAQQEDTGDGRHVGSVLQAIHRVQMLFYFMSHTWPGGDTDVPQNLGGGRTVEETFTAKNGRQSPYTVVLPPGYDDPGNATKRYPVAYMFHGLGMDPMGFGMLGAIANSAMVNDSVPPSRRLQKVIIVTADGRCRPGGNVHGGSLPMTGDLCEEGTYYSDHPGGTYLGQTQLIELEDIVESKYRVKAPADVEVVQ